jgi:hypothetical protein
MLTSSGLPYAALAFGIAHFIYISSFGFRPFSIGTAVPVFAIELCVVAYIFPFIEDPPMKVIMPSYMTILFVMVWRSIVKYDSRDIANIFGAIGKQSLLLIVLLINSR